MSRPLTGPAEASSDGLQVAYCWSPASAASQLSLFTAYSEAAEPAPCDRGLDALCPGQEGGTTLGKPTNPKGEPGFDDLTYSPPVQHHNEMKTRTRAAYSACSPCARLWAKSQSDHSHKSVRLVSQAVRGAFELGSAFLSTALAATVLVLTVCGITDDFAPSPFQMLDNSAHCRTRCFSNVQRR